MRVVDVGAVACTVPCSAGWLGVGVRDVRGGVARPREGVYVYLPRAGVAITKPRDVGVRRAWRRAQRRGGVVHPCEGVCVYLPRAGVVSRSCMVGCGECVPCCVCLAGGENGTKHSDGGILCYFPFTAILYRYGYHCYEQKR